MQCSWVALASRETPRVLSVALAYAKLALLLERYEEDQPALPI